MNAMIRSDLITMKNSAIQLAIMPLIAAVAILAMTGSLLASVAAVSAMLPFLFIFSISAYDEMNGWERFRLTLPITRHQVAYGRYGSTLIVVAACSVCALLFAAVAAAVLSALWPDGSWMGTYAETELPEEALAEMMANAVCAVSALILLVAAFSYPLIMRFGMTKGTRFAPIALIFLFAFGLWLFSDSGLVDGLGESFANSPMLLGILALAASLILYVLSALLSARLYARRQF